MTMTIHRKLMLARQSFHQLPLKKTGFNSFSKYSYFELHDFLVPGMDCMAQHGLLPVISFGADQATMTIYDVDSDATIVITSPVVPIELKGSNAMQSMGACQTYVTRYLWVTALQCVENDALDCRPPAEQEEKPAPATKKVAKPATEQDYATINEYVAANYIPPKTLEWLKVEKHWNELTHSQATKVIAACKKYEGE